MHSINQLPSTTSTNVNPLHPEFIRVDEAIRISSIKKTKLYQWLGEGKIKSVCIRERGAARGVRLIEYNSLISFINSFSDGFDKS